MIKGGDTLKNKKKSIVAIVVVSATLIVVSLYTLFGRNFTMPENILKDSFQMVEYYLFKSPMENIRGIITKFNKLDDVYKENEILKEQLNRIAQVINENNVLKADIEELRALLGIEFLPSDYQSQIAVVMDRDIESWQSELVISLGRSNGLEEGMVVVNDKGMVGRVSVVGEATSTVTLLSTEKLKDQLPVMVRCEDGTYVYGILNGFDVQKQAYEVKLLSSTTTVQIGAEVSTSGYGGRSPRGILVGSVLMIDNRFDTNAPYIYVEPSVDYGAINYVSVVRRADTQ